MCGAQSSLLSTALVLPSLRYTFRGRQCAAVSTRVLLRSNPVHVSGEFGSELDRYTRFLIIAFNSVLSAGMRSVRHPSMNLKRASVLLCANVRAASEHPALGTPFPCLISSAVYFFSISLVGTNSLLGTGLSNSGLRPRATPSRRSLFRSFNRDIELGGCWNISNEFCRNLSTSCWNSKISEGAHVGYKKMKNIGMLRISSPLEYSTLTELVLFHTRPRMQDVKMPLFSWGGKEGLSLRWTC